MPSNTESYVRDLLLKMASAIVPDSGAVSVDMETKDKGVLYTVHCKPEDARFLIGKGGINAQGIKAIARAAGQKGGIKVEVQLDVPNRGSDAGSGGSTGGGNQGAPLPPGPEVPGGTTAAPLEHEEEEAPAQAVASTMGPVASPAAFTSPEPALA